MTSDPVRGLAAILVNLASVIVCSALPATAGRPARFPADVYDPLHGVAHPADRVEAAALAEAMPAVEWSGCLALAAEVVLTETLDAPDLRLPDDRLHTVTRAAGCTDPLPRVLMVDTSESSTVDVVAELRRVERDVDGPATHAGIARAPIDRGRFRWRWVVILSARPAELAEAVPRILEPGAVVPLRFRLLQDELDAPTAVIARPDGGLRHRALEPAGGEWWTLVPAGTATGPLAVQLFAESRTGPRLVAVLDLSVGPSVLPMVSEHDPPSPGPRTFDSLEDARRWMVSRLAALRREAGVGQLVSDPVLDRVATAHCEDMRRSGFVGHRSPTTGELTDRLGVAGVDYRSARENVAWAADVESAMRQLERSPAHRANLLAADVDRVGIGLVATSDGGDPQRQWLVTQVLVGSTSGFTVNGVLAAATDGVDRWRERRGLPSAVRCPELDAAALGLAEEPYAFALDAETGLMRVRDGLGERPQRWGSLQLAVVRVNEPREVRLPDLLVWDRSEAWGVAVRRAPVDDLPPFQVVWVASDDLPSRACD